MDSFNKYLNLIDINDRENVKKLILDLFKDIKTNIDKDSLTSYELILPNSTIRKYVDEDLINFLKEVGFLSDDYCNEYFIIQKEKFKNLNF